MNNTYYFRSPDLTPLDFFLWGFIKDKVYEVEVENEQDLIARLHAAVAEITPQMLQRVRENVLVRVRACLEVGGGHFEQIL